MFVNSQPFNFIKDYIKKYIFSKNYNWNVLKRILKYLNFKTIKNINAGQSPDNFKRHSNIFADKIILFYCITLNIQTDR